MRLHDSFHAVHQHTTALALQWQFPERPCRVSFHVPADQTDLAAYEITFWQLANKGVPA